VVGLGRRSVRRLKGAECCGRKGTWLSKRRINWTLCEMNRRIDVDVGVAYGSNPRRVMALLNEVASLLE